MSADEHQSPNKNNTEQPDSLNQGGLSGKLLSFVSNPPDALVLEWTDEIALHGGTTFRVYGDGKVLRIETRMGKTVETAGLVSKAEVGELLRMLIDAKVFDTPAPSRAGVPDEIQIRVSASLGAETLWVWRWEQDFDFDTPDPIGLAKAHFFALCWK